MGFWHTSKVFPSVKSPTKVEWARLSLLGMVIIIIIIIIIIMKKKRKGKRASNYYFEI
jgi:hypothetical protein